MPWGANPRYEIAVYVYSQQHVYRPKYVDVIIKRWEDFTGEKAELIEG